MFFRIYSFIQDELVYLVYSVYLLFIGCVSSIDYIMYCLLNYMHMTIQFNVCTLHDADPVANADL